MSESSPNIAAVYKAQGDLAPYTLRTPVVRCAAIEAVIGHDAIVYAKLEFLQRTGTFKARGAIATLLTLTTEQLDRGVTAVSAGNHAIATAYAAKALGTSAKVVMTSSANRERVAAAEALGAQVILSPDVHAAFAAAKKIQEDEGRFLVHPFEGPNIALGTGTLGVEVCEQVEAFDAIIIPVGGGGLIGGLSNAVRQLRPEVEIIGVEPTGADSMHKSFASGEPESIDSIDTIADSLGAPYALPYSFALTRQNVDRLVRVDDQQLRTTMGFLFQAMSIAVESACAASTAALLGPLRKRLQGKRIVLVMCGSNIDWATFEQHAIFDICD